jgi:hypothetical protein
MPDDDQTPIDAVDDGELLAAYLDGQTDDVTTARLERRLADEAALAERLDAIAQVRVRLQRVAEVTAPAEARQRLRDELARARGGDAPTGDALTTEPAPTGATAGSPPGEGVAPPAGRRRWWARHPGPALAAAAVVVVALFGAATLLRPIGGADSGEALIADDDAVGEGAADGDAGREELDTAAQLEERGAEAADTTSAAGTAAVAVAGDREIAARARELSADPPGDLRARERRLRERAALPADRLCVTELDAATVDLVDEGGRVSLAVLLNDVDQIVLLRPRTCAAIRTIPAAR